MRDNAKEATRQAETEHDTILTVDDAAVVLGITPGAVRKRIERGHLSARKHRGQWRVILHETDATRHDETDTTRQTRPHDNAVKHDPAPQVEAVNSMIARAVAEAVAPIERQNNGLLERVATPG